MKRQKTVDCPEKYAASQKDAAKMAAGALGQNPSEWCARENATLKRKNLPPVHTLWIGPLPGPESGSLLAEPFKLVQSLKNS